MRRHIRHGIALAASVALAVGTAAAAPAEADQGRQAPTQELTTTTRLADRRSVVVGDQFYAVSTADGLYPAAGWHITREMGGFWTPLLKLLDGLWFGIDRAWLGKQAHAESHTPDPGYTRTRYAALGVCTSNAPTWCPTGCVPV